MVCPRQHPWHSMSTPCADIGNSLLGHSTTDRFRLVGTTCWIGKNTNQVILSSHAGYFTSLSTYWHDFGTWHRSSPHLGCAYNRSIQQSNILYGEGPRSDYASPPYNLDERTVVWNCWTLLPSVGRFC